MAEGRIKSTLGRGHSFAEIVEVWWVWWERCGTELIVGTGEAVGVGGAEVGAYEWL